MSEVYYRVFRGKDRELCVVTLQDFDEVDYDQSRFVTDQKFDALKDALTWLEDYRERHSRQHGLRKSELREALVDLFAANHDILTDVRADQIIGLVEDMGMIPPTRDADRRSSYGYARINQWEKEEDDT